MAKELGEKHGEFFRVRAEPGPLKFGTSLIKTSHPPSTPWTSPRATVAWTPPANVWKSEGHGVMLGV